MSCRYILDTNIILGLVRGNSSLSAELESRFSLFTGRNERFISYVTRAEIIVLGQHHQWGAERWTALNRLLWSFKVVEVSGEDVLNAYITVDTFSRFLGRDIGSKNDIWIAASAIAHDMTVLTTDKDFDHLIQVGLSVERLIIAPKNY